MFSDLPNLLGHNFAIGFFLPVALFLTVMLGMTTAFGLIQPTVPQTSGDILIITTIGTLATWLIGIILLILNRTLYRFLEGYGRFNPLQIATFLQLRRYRYLKRRKEELDNEFRVCIDQSKAFPHDRERNRVMEELANCFPDQESFILPTDFGNIIRAFEVYPRIMYGFESIIGWDRLLGVIPKEYRDLIESAKTRTDFWINLSMLTMLSLLIYFALIIKTQQIPMSWFIPGAVMVILVAYLGAKSAALEWGSFVKSAFDLFLPDLCTKLGYTLPISEGTERDFWNRFSQATLYRIPSRLPKRGQINDANTQSTAKHGE